MVDVGDVLSGRRGTYTLEAFLGEGLTARVFKARASYLDHLVAVKVLKFNLDDEVVRRFEQEALLIGEVVAALDRANGKWRSADPKLKPAQPPRVYEMWLPKSAVATDRKGTSQAESPSSQQPAFMAMALILGRKMEEILALDGPLAEAQGLLLGVQLFGLFQVLHEEVRRTYADFKFENLWWDAEAQQLWVTDWNVLSASGELSGIPRDLERGARALVTVLTGHPLAPGRALSRHPGWQGLSEGARQLLTAMLHPIKERRPASAEEVRKELLVLLNAWEGEINRQLDEAEDALEAFEHPVGGQEARGALHRAVGILGVLRARHERGQRERPWPTALVTRLDALWDRASAHAAKGQRTALAARQMLEAGSASAARDMVRQMLAEDPDDLALHRLLSVAETLADGLAGARRERQALFDALEHCSEDEFAEAQNALRFITNPAVASALRHEIEGRVAWAEALKESNPQKAWAAAQRARREFDALDRQYREAVLLSLPDNLDERRALLRRAAEEESHRRKGQELAQKLQALESQRRWEQALDEVEASFPLYADVPEAVEAVQALILGRLQASDAERARYLCAAALRTARSTAFFSGYPDGNSQQTSDAGAGEETGEGVALRVAPALLADREPLFRLAWDAAAALQSLSRPPQEQDPQAHAFAQKVLQAAREQGGKVDGPAQEAYRKLADLLESALTRAGAGGMTLKAVLQKAWRASRSAVRLIIEEVVGLPPGLLALMADLLPATSGGAQAFAQADSDKTRRVVLATALGGDALIEGLKNTAQYGALTRDQRKDLIALLSASDPSLLAEALAEAVKGKSVESLGGTHWLAIAASVLGIHLTTAKTLRDWCQRNGGLRQELADGQALQVALAGALGLPGNIALLEALAKEASDPAKLARELAQLAQRIDPAKAQSRADPTTSTKRAGSKGGEPALAPSSPEPSPEAAPSRPAPAAPPGQGPAPRTVLSFSAPAPAGSAGEPSPSLAELRRLLTANDPREWEQALALAQKFGKLPEADERSVKAREVELAEHRRAMERLWGQELARDAEAALAAFGRWEEGHRLWPVAWDPEGGGWRPVAEVRQELERAAARQAVRRRAEAARRLQAAGQGAEAQRLVQEALAMAGADQALAAEVWAVAGGAAGLEEEVAGLKRLLEKPLAESATLSDLRVRLENLVQHSMRYRATLAAQVESLAVWERREAELDKLEQEGGAVYSEQAVQAADTYLTYLDELLARPCWQPYGVAEAPVFRRVRQRLEQIKGRKDRGAAPEHGLAADIQRSLFAGPAPPKPPAEPAQERKVPSLHDQILQGLEAKAKQTKDTRREG